MRQTWDNGAKGSYVKKVIDDNFIELYNFMSESVKGNQSYVKIFTASDWRNGAIFIQNTEYEKLNPYVEVYIKNKEGYSAVIGGYIINDSGIELQSDIPYDGKVVIR